MGASGDLAPLAHLALGLMGEGTMWSPKTGWAAASDVLAASSLTPIRLAHKVFDNLQNNISAVSLLLLLLNEGVRGGLEGV